MERKQRKALARRKAIVKARNIRNNNWPKARRFTGFTPFVRPRGTVYRLWDI